MLKAAHLTRSANRRKILDDVCFDIKLGTTMTLLGPSGSGKTSLLRVIMGLDRVDGGELWIDSACLVGSNTFVAPEARNVSLVFQDFILFPHLNVIDNLVFGLKKPARDNRLITELLELLEIDRLAKRRIDRLSGGEQQRVALARALVVKPRVLLMDEPFSNIDCIMRDRIQERLLAWLKAAGTTTLIATHDHKEAFFFRIKEGHFPYGVPNGTAENPSQYF